MSGRELKKISAGIVLALCSPAMFAYADNRLLALNDLTGIWAPQRYLDSLDLTHSAIAAPVEEVRISNEKDEGWRLHWTNFHESSWRRILSLAKDANGEDYLLTVSDWEVKSSSASPHPTIWRLRVVQDKSSVRSFEFLDSDSITNKRSPFVRMAEPLSKYVLRKLLAGQYMDSAQKPYEFTLYGQARWPGQTFPFEVSLDPSETDCDYIYQPLKARRETPNAYGFRWHDQELYLFHIIATDDPIHCEEKPFVILKRSPV